MLFALGQDRSPTAPYRAIPFVPGASTKRLKIGFDLRSYYGELPHPDVQRALEAMAQVCSDLGHTVVETQSPVDSEFELRFNQIFGPRMVGLADAAAAKAGRPPKETGLLDTFVLEWSDFARRFTPQDTEDANRYMLELGARYDEWLSGMDVFLSPVLMGPAPKWARCLTQRFRSRRCSNGSRALVPIPQSRMRSACRRCRFPPE